METMDLPGLRDIRISYDGGAVVLSYMPEPDSDDLGRGGSPTYVKMPSEDTAHYYLNQESMRYQCGVALDKLREAERKLDMIIHRRKGYRTLLKKLRSH